MRLPRVEYDIIWGGEVADVAVRTVGQAAAEGLNAFGQEMLSDSRWGPGMRVLIDHRELDWNAMTTGDLRMRADLFVRDRERLGKPYVALVNGRQMDYGLQRMMEAFTDDVDATTERDLFYPVEEARAWLGQFPPPPTQPDRACLGCASVLSPADSAAARTFAHYRRSITPLARCTSRSTTRVLRT